MTQHTVAAAEARKMLRVSRKLWGKERMLKARYRVARKERAGRISGAIVSGRLLEYVDSQTR